MTGYEDDTAILRYNPICCAADSGAVAGMLVFRGKVCAGRDAENGQRACGGYSEGLCIHC